VNITSARVTNHIGKQTVMILVGMGVNLVFLDNLPNTDLSFFHSLEKIAKKIRHLKTKISFEDIFVRVYESFNKVMLYEPY
jgi:biotin-(acetyl-CoA carboxylase) ligase